MYQRILVPLEREGTSEAPVQHASALAANVGAEVVLLRVITVIPSDDYFFQRIQLEEGSRGAQRQVEAEAHVHRLEGELRERGVTVDPQVIVSDKAEDEAIVEYATQANCDLIVLPDQQSSLISRWLKGNVAAKVQRHSRVPVLIVKDEN